ncbi:LysR family transcriptional regulator [uncultured Roseovarius sp.]|uniref:LysR family transcriptional regulator n=1 Tax=Roseovarius sp. TaxID=1486281 RepID=UPI0025F17FAC|nr:LysR family transcriptional regulator [uncultured Roseovarius sp.]
MKAIPISLRQIDYVIAAADTGSTAAAARALNVSQPSVSLAISKVEDHFGRPLFVRSVGQGISPTAFGLRKLGAMRNLRAQAQSTLDHKDNGTETLNLGVFSTLGPRYAPALVNGFLEISPEAQIKLHEGDLDQLSRWLESGRIDLALIYEFGLPSSLEIVPLADVRPYGLVARAHPLAGRGRVGLAELLADPLILMSLPHSRDYFLTLAQVNGIRPRIAHETGSVEMLRSMVANHMGVGLLATDIAQDTACDGQPVIRLELADRLVPHRIALARSPHPHMTSLVAAFREHVVSSFMA